MVWCSLRWRLARLLLPGLRDDWLLDAGPRRTPEVEQQLGWDREHENEDDDGRMTVEDIVNLMVWHDANHLDQLQRALLGEA